MSSRLYPDGEPRQGFRPTASHRTYFAVTAHSWTREIQIEQFASRNESAWCDSMPPDATSVTRTREVRSTRQVADGQTCTHGRELLTESWVGRKTFDADYCHRLGFAVLPSAH